MDLAKFLLESTQSHAREAILNHKLLFDLKVAAGESGYHLQNYYFDVDHDGFDVVLDDGVDLRKFQLKSVRHKGKGETLASTLDEYRSEFPAIMTQVCGNTSP